MQNKHKYTLITESNYGLKDGEPDLVRLESSYETNNDCLDEAYFFWLEQAIRTTASDFVADDLFKSERDEPTFTIQEIRNAFLDKEDVYDEMPLPESEWSAWREMMERLYAAKRGDF